jgi:CRP-like cAMP-binding protein
MSNFDLFKNERNAKDFPAGATIFEDGSPADYMYAVLEGEVDIVKHGRIYETVSQGGTFGELALIDNSPRNAAAVAKSDCRLALIDARRFTFLVQQTPFFALQVMKVMADRLRAVMRQG